MIEVNQISNYIETALNSVGNNKFKIYADVGEFQQSYRPQASNNITHYVNGILSAMTPDIIPIKNIQVATQSMQIGFVFDIDLLDKDENGNFIEVENVKNILNSWAMGVNGKPFALSDSNNVVFEITPTFQGITVGTASQLSPIGDVLPIYFNISFVIIEAGINSNSVSIFLNGENLFFQSLSVSRVRVSETNMFASEQSTRTVIQSNGINYSFQMPLLNTPQCLEIENDILGGNLNKAQLVEYVRNNVSKQYIMVFGDDGLALEPAKNIGLNFNLVEGKQDILNYNNNWQTRRLEYSETTSINVDLPQGTYVVIFWGDGTSENVTGETTATHLYNSGVYDLRIFAK